jgi:hypothetical protein
VGHVGSLLAWPPIVKLAKAQGLFIGY